jgi:hypothetical protein
METHEAIAFAERWLQVYNSDRRRFVYDLYDPNCTVSAPGRDLKIVGVDAVWEATRVAMDAVPDRAMVRLERVLVSPPSTIVCEVVMRGHGRESLLCFILDVDNGRVQRECTYH